MKTKVMYSRPGLMMLATLALVASSSGVAQADMWPMFTTNHTEMAGPARSMWVTIYDAGETQHLDWGCVEAGTTRQWLSGNYLPPGVYHMRAEIKENADCSGATLCDTRIKVGQLGSDWENSAALHVNIDTPGCYWALGNM